MASGDTLLVFTAEMNQPPATNPATLDWENRRPVLDFSDDTGTDEYAIFTGVMPQSYDGGGVDVYVYYSVATDADGGTVVWATTFERLEAGAGTGDGWGTPNTMTADTATEDDVIVIHSDSVSNGAEMNSVVGGDLFRFRIMRDVSADNVVGDVCLHAVEIRET